LHALDTETAAFYEGTAAEGKPYAIESKFRPDSCEYVLIVNVRRQPPDRLGLLLGDFVHNLRSALDHLVCQLSLLEGPTDCSDTQYPICFNKGRFNQLKGNWLKGVSARHRAAIEKTQPYHGRRPESHPLAVLDWLDRIDKHRVLHPSFGVFVDPGQAGAEALVFLPNADAGAILCHKIAKTRRIESKAEIAVLKLAPFGPEPKVEMRGNLTFDPAFSERWIRGQELPQILKVVKELVEFFAPDFS
jgi:hypothetical protein